MLYYNALVISDGKAELGYVATEGAYITDVGYGTVPQQLLNIHPLRRDLNGKWLIPGVIDTHVHFREPGLTHKGDIYSESRAALAGGVTSCIDMPNVKPQTTTIETVDWKMHRANEMSAVNYACFIGATNDNLDQLERADYTRVAGIKVFMGSSTGNMLVDDGENLDKIFSLPCLVAVHCEDTKVIKENIERLKKEYGEHLPVGMHPYIRDVEACYKSSADAVERAKRLGTRLHVLHLSTNKELSLFSKLPHDKITAEVCVGHLWFSAEDYPRLGTKIKVNPSIKSVSERDALRAAIGFELIDTVATDHAPHLMAEKMGNALTAASGMPMIRHSLQVMTELVLDGVIDKTRMVELMCHSPAKVFRIVNRGHILPGYYADLTVIDPHEGETVDSATEPSKCAWSPLDGVKFRSKVVSTMVNGVETMHDDIIADNAADAAMALSFNQ